MKGSDGKSQPGARTLPSNSSRIRLSGQAFILLLGFSLLELIAGEVERRFSRLRHNDICLSRDSEFFMPCLYTIRPSRDVSDSITPCRLGGTKICGGDCFSGCILCPRDSKIWIVEDNNLWSAGEVFKYNRSCCTPNRASLITYPVAFI